MATFLACLFELHAASKYLQTTAARCFFGAGTQLRRLGLYSCNVERQKAEAALILAGAPNARLALHNVSSGRLLTCRVDSEGAAEAASAAHAAAFAALCLGLCQELPLFEMPRVYATMKDLDL